MDTRANKTHNSKGSERLNKLCNTIRGLSEKDITSVSYIIEKSSRIASVTLLLADVLEGNTLLKEELQRTAMGLIRDSSFGALSVRGREALVQQLVVLHSLLDAYERSGQLSRMNTETLADEVVALSDFINNIDWHSGRRFADSDLFGGEVPREVFTPEPHATYISPLKSHERDMQSTVSSPQIRRDDRESREAAKDIDTQGRVQYRERVQEIQKDRRATILGLVQKKDRITVKDAANLIKDCSEKTIQRELLALVKQGVLKKEGERRWSTYSLA